MANACSVSQSCGKVDVDVCKFLLVDIVAQTQTSSEVEPGKQGV